MNNKANYKYAIAFGSNLGDRNVFVAIALSMSVLLFWGAFFETPKKTSEQQTNQKVEQKNKQGSIAPTINQPQIIT